MGVEAALGNVCSGQHDSLGFKTGSGGVSRWKTPGASLSRVNVTVRFVKRLLGRVERSGRCDRGMRYQRG